MIDYHGEITMTEILIDPYIKDLTRVIQNTSMTTTYKMVWIRSIIEICKSDRNLKTIHFDQISEKAFEFYWNQTIFFNLAQGSNPNQHPVIYQIVADEIKKYQDVFGHQPKLYSKVRDQVQIPVAKITFELGRYVSQKFPLVSGKKYKIYDLDLKSKTIRPYRPDLIHDHFELLSDIISYRWVQFLEGFNNAPRISKKMKATDQQNVKRDTQLRKFWQYLDLENPDHICFHSGKPIQEGNLSVDHVIPWSYIFSDDIWNLVYVDRAVNSSKGNSIPGEEIIQKLESRNKELLSLMQAQFPENKQTHELVSSINLGLVRKNWIGCQ